MSLEDTVNANLDDASDKDEFGVVPLLLMSLLGCFLCLFLATRIGVGAVKDAHLFKQADMGQAVIVERLTQPAGRNGRGGKNYYLRYKFDNPAVETICSLDRDTRLTPPDRACQIIVRRVRVDPETYKAIEIPATVDALYVNRGDMTWVALPDYEQPAKKLGYLAVFLGLFFICALWGLNFARLLLR